MEINIKQICAAAIALLAALPATAQYDQDIDVEGKYTPEYIAMDRIGMFPKPVKFSVEKSSLVYSLHGVNSNFRPDAVPAVATGWNDTRVPDDSRGYLDFGIGSWFNSTLSAGYRIFDEEDATLGIRLQHNSTSLWDPSFTGNSGYKYEGASKMWRTDESLGIYGSSTFSGVGTLDAAVDYHLGCFDYYGFYPSAGMPENASSPTQTLNDISARLRWSAPASSDNLFWFVGAGVRYFGFRNMYYNTLPGQLNHISGARETDLYLDAGIAYSTSSKSTIGLDLRADRLGYGDGEMTAYGEVMPHTYGAMSLNPYYRFSRANINIRIGVQIDLAFNARDAEGRYRTFNIAPDVRLDYRKEAFAVYLNLLGGNSLRTLASFYDKDYYMAPMLSESVPEYSPLDATLGFGLGPFSGFHAGLEFKYRVTHNQSLLGWYQTLISPSSDFPASSAGLSAEILTMQALAATGVYNLSGYSLGINLGYDAGRYFKINAAATYQPQSADHGYFNGIDRAEWTARASVETNPWSSLKFSLTADWRGGRGFLTSTDKQTRVLYGVPNLFSLNFGASYDVTKKIGVWLQADNLTGRKNFYAPSVPEPGIAFSIGASFKFN